MTPEPINESSARTSDYPSYREIAGMSLEQMRRKLYDAIDDKDQLLFKTDSDANETEQELVSHHHPEGVEEALNVISHGLDQEDQEEPLKYRYEVYTVLIIIGLIVNPLFIKSALLLLGIIVLIILTEFSAEHLKREDMTRRTSQVSMMKTSPMMMFRSSPEPCTYRRRSRQLIAGQPLRIVQ